MSEYQIGDYNRAGYLAFLFCMAFTIVFFIYIAFIHPGVDLKEIQIPETQKEAPVAPAAAETPAPAQ
jgi:hypothetical protein